MIGVIAKNKDGVEESMSISEWQIAEKLGYTFVRTYSSTETEASTESSIKVYIQPTISPKAKSALPAKKKGCGCGK